MDLKEKCCCVGSKDSCLLEVEEAIWGSSIGLVNQVAASNEDGDRLSQFHRWNIVFRQSIQPGRDYQLTN